MKNNQEANLIPFNLDMFKKGINAFDSFGVEFKFIDYIEHEEYPVKVKTVNAGVSASFTKEGRYFSNLTPGSLDLIYMKPEYIKVQLTTIGSLLKQGKTTKPLIQKDKKYTTSTGRKVTILCTDYDNTTYPVVAVLDNKIAGMFTAFGEYNYGFKQDLIEWHPWLNVKKDTLIEVYDENSEDYIPRYFCKYENEKVLVYVGGATSFTTTSLHSYKVARLIK